MKIEKAERRSAKIKLGLQGPSGSGKTMSSLHLSFGLVNDWSKICVIDTENRSSSLYSHLGHFNIINLDGPFPPEKFIDAINLAENAGMECIIIDSASHAWEFLTDYHATLPGNSFTNYAKITPRHKAFMNAIIQSKCHVICCMRTKQDYIIQEKNGKMVPEKIGLKAIQKSEFEYELSISFELAANNLAKISKDRTGLFANMQEHKLSIEDGIKIRNWCNEVQVPMEDRINSCRTLNELLSLYKLQIDISGDLKKLFEAKKYKLLNPTNHSLNGLDLANK